MGGSCSHAADALVNIVTEEEIRDALKSFNAWNKIQDEIRNTGGSSTRNGLGSGPLLQRVGGEDVVKQVVEGFYRRLYSDQGLLMFLCDRDIVYLRAKQSAFMSWLFGPPNIPYSGKNLRTAHLKLIKQRGFSPEDFDLGMEYFEAAMQELQVSEAIIREVMGKVRPFKEVIFTPSPKDAQDEAQWAVEEHLKLQVLEFGKSMASRRYQPPSAGAAPTASPAASTTPAAGNGSSRGPQCPFTAG
ncbi:hypothetical protein Vretimale_16792, partial [Volvox reticuliferus]